MMINPLRFIKQRNGLLVEFLQGLSWRTFDHNVNGTAQFHTACVIESVYSLMNFNWILPNSFISNLIQTFISGSKTVSLLNGKLSPGGSSTTYYNWLNNTGSEPITCPNGDLDTYFDNIGRYVVKNYQVSKNKSAAADIITTTLHIPLAGKSCLRTNPLLKPSVWVEKISADLQKK